MTGFLLTLAIMFLVLLPTLLMTASVTCAAGFVVPQYLFIIPPSLIVCAFTQHLFRDNIFT